MCLLCHESWSSQVFIQSEIWATATFNSIACYSISGLYVPLDQSPDWKFTAIYSPQILLLHLAEKLWIFLSFGQHMHTQMPTYTYKYSHANPPRMSTSRKPKIVNFHSRLIREIIFILVHVSIFANLKKNGSTHIQALDLEND